MPTWTKQKAHACTAWSCSLGAWERRLSPGSFKPCEEESALRKRLSGSYLRRFCAGSLCLCIKVAPASGALSALFCCLRVTSKFDWSQWGTMSDSIENVAIFGATGMTGLATLSQAVAAGEKLDDWFGFKENNNKTNKLWPGLQTETEARELWSG